MTSPPPESAVAYEPTGWWRSIGPDGSLWGESSSESEIRQMARPGDTIQRHMRRVEERWENAPPHPPLSTPSAHEVTS